MRFRSTLVSAATGLFLAVAGSHAAEAITVPGDYPTVQAALTALRRDDLVARDADRYVVVDSLMREWVARRTF